MGLFNRRRKLDNTAAGVLPPPGPTTIHNHESSRIGEIAGYTLAGIAALVFLWIALSFLFDKMGGSDKEAAILVVSIPVVLAAGWLLKWLIPDIVLAIQKESHLFQLEMAREMTRREEVRLLAAQTALEPGRYNEEDYLLARVIVSVMERAYTWLEKEKRDRFPARWRPWSKTQVLETAEKIGVAITQDQALQVAKDLAADGIITAPDLGQISKNYPTLSSVRAYLDNKYGRPIVAGPPAVRSNAGYVPIKN